MTPREPAAPRVTTPRRLSRATMLRLRVGMRGRMRVRGRLGRPRLRGRLDAGLRVALRASPGAGLGLRLRTRPGARPGSGAGLLAGLRALPGPRLGTRLAGLRAGGNAWLGGGRGGHALIVATVNTACMLVSLYSRGMDEQGVLT